MLSLALALCLMVATIPSGRCGTVKRRRDSGVMASDYIGDDYTDYGGDIYGNAEYLLAYYEIVYDKKFNAKWLDPTSPAFRKEEKKVVKVLTRELARKLEIVDSDVEVRVLTFIPGSTKAEISVSIPLHYTVSIDEITENLRSMLNNSRIGKSNIFAMTDLNAPLGDDPVGQEMAIVFELTYKNDIRNQAAALQDVLSPEFQTLAKRISTQFEILLVDPLYTYGSISLTPDQIDTTVLKISSEGRFTKAEIEVYVAGVDVETLAESLSAMMEIDLRIDGGRIVGIDELNRIPVAAGSGGGPFDGADPNYYETDYGSEEGVEEEDYNGEIIEAEVMSDKIDGSSPVPDTTDPPAREEPTPPQPSRTVPKVAATEPTPPAIPGAAEPTPPGNCGDFDTPRYGTVACSTETRLGSICFFTCNSDTKMIGTDTIECGINGRWNEDPPVCLRVFCQPPVHSILDGKYDCSNANHVRSTCAFECDDGFRLVGADRITCARTELWTADQPTCELIPIDCEEEYEEWSECSGGSRSRNEVIVRRGSTSTTCPALEEACIDCALEWGDWSECSDGTRIRIQTITQPRVGAGLECPELDAQTQECTPCEVGLGEWSACNGSLSIRSQIITKEATNGGTPCPSELREETTECAHCVVEWSEWSGCKDGVRTRQQVVATPQIGNGDACLPLQQESEVCVDCELEWGDWESCIDGLSRRVQFVAVEKEGAGEECEAPQDDYRACAVCVLGWAEWSECDGTERTRRQRIIQQPVQEDPCPPLEEESEACADCVYEWSDWSECDFGGSTRTLIKQSEPVGSGKACPSQTTEKKDCCFLFWGEWSKCVDGQRERSEQVLTQPEGETCRVPEVEFEDCSDCAVEWGNWSTCENNMIKRTQFVKDPGSGGEPCPDLGEEVDYCADCVVGWGAWGECSQGERIRQQEIVEESIGAGLACPELLQVEVEECHHCESSWGDWSTCSNGIRERSLVISQQRVGAGDPCPQVTTDSEACVDCVVEWRPWSLCDSGERTREQYVVVQPVGAGEACESLQLESEECVDCVMEWGPWSECSEGQRQKSQVETIARVGAGRECAPPQVEFEVCIDCVVEWTEWSGCFGGVQSRRQTVTVRSEGAGEPCPSEALPYEEKACEGSSVYFEELVCRFVGTVLGYKRRPSMRDLLLIADESGSIGRINFDKIKSNFKSVARNIKGGVGIQESQIAMTSFGLFSRMQFDFDDHSTVDDVESAIDKSYFVGGYRSHIGLALTEANIWLFQQSAGMRGFPEKDDNIEHEILIATDGCRTADLFSLQEGLANIKKRGIKLYVLGIASRDPRCRKTIDAMVEDENDLFMLNSWDQLEEMSQRLDDGVCQTDVGSGAPDTEDTDVGSGAPPQPSRGDSARARRDASEAYKLGEFDQ